MWITEAIVSLVRRETMGVGVNTFPLRIVYIKAGERSLEISRMRKTICSDWSQIGKFQWLPNISLIYPWTGPSSKETFHRRPDWITQISPGRTIILPSSVCTSSLPFWGMINIFPSLSQTLRCPSKHLPHTCAKQRLPFESGLHARPWF